MLQKDVRVEFFRLLRLDSNENWLSITIKTDREQQQSTLIVNNKNYWKCFWPSQETEHYNYTKWFINRVAISTIILHKIFKNREVGHQICERIYKDL